MAPFIKKIITLERIDALIRRKGTGSPKELASRLDISVRYVHKLLDYLRSLGAEISYNHCRNSYEYLNEDQFQFAIGLTKGNQLKMKGGQTFLQFFSSLHNLCSESEYTCNIS